MRVYKCAGILTNKYMPLYKADLFDTAEPVNSVDNSVPPKKRARKGKTVPENMDPTPERDVAHSGDGNEKKKRVLSEAQKAALLKGQETRKRKREEAAAAKAAEEKRVADEAAAEAAKLEAAAAKKEYQKAERKRKREEKKAAERPGMSDTSGELEKELDAAVKELNKGKGKGKAKKVVNDNEPPAWFKSYVASVKKEENLVAAEKKPVKVIKEESAAVAAERWNDGVTRDRLKSEQDRHFANTYSMIFGRRMK